MTKEKIIQELQKGFDKAINTTEVLEVTSFFQRIGSKWSVAENLEHLILSVKPLTLAFSVPKFFLLLFGKPNRQIRTYAELVNRYQNKLEEGGRATSSFIPKANYTDKALLLKKFKTENQRFLKSLVKWDEKDLDRYLIPHPLLGKLYVREMLYFTIYHTQHHLKAINNYDDVKQAN
ncbi:MAG: DinB family protein [Bacteroidia bacterium]|nr:DinB family protein [Bacteroidia bacterium]